MSKILQIIPAPDGLEVKEKLYQSYGTIEKDVVIDGEKWTQIDDDLRWDGDYDFVKPVCLALVETNEGAREIHPIVIDDGDHPDSESGLIDLADYECYIGMDYSEAENAKHNIVTIEKQNRTGFVSATKGNFSITVQAPIDPDSDAPVNIVCCADGNSQVLGSYSNKVVAEYVYEDFREKLWERGEYNMPSAEMADRVIGANKRINEWAHAKSKNSEINRSFTNKTVEVLIGAGCYTLDEVKALTKDILLSRTKRRKPETVERVIVELQEHGYLTE